MNDQPRDLHLFADVHEYRAYRYAGGSDFAFYRGADVDAEAFLDRIRALQLRDIYLHGDVELNRPMWNTLRARQRNPFSARVYQLAEAEAPPYEPLDGYPDCRHCDNGIDIPADFANGACPKCGRDCIPF